MVRSLWFRALATSLLWTGAVCAQQSAAKPDNNQTEQILTIQEAGKKPQKCKVIQTWRTSDGHQAYQVRAIDTGEMMTITEKVASSGTYGAKPRGIAMQIYHWGSMHISPPNVPAPNQDKSSGLSSYAVKSQPQSSSNSLSPYLSPSAQTRTTQPSNPYSPPNYPPATSAKTVSTPTPEKDWRQSWAKADDKPLKIEDKPKTRESIADAPQLKIEGKVPAKDYALKLPRAKADSGASSADSAKTASAAETKTAAKQGNKQLKPTLGSDDPLLHPDEFMPKSLDITPRKKVADAPATPTTSAKATSSGVKPAMDAASTSTAHVPTLADFAAGTRTESKVISLPTPSAAAPTADIAKSRAVPPSVAAIPNVSPSVKSTSNKIPGPVALPELPDPMVDLKSSTAAEPPGIASTPILPTIPEPSAAPKPPTKLPPAEAPKIVVNASKPALTPVIPLLPEPAKSLDLPAKQPSIETSLSAMDANVALPTPPVAPPVVPLMPAAPPVIPTPKAEVAQKPLPPQQPIRGERPNFLVMQPSREGDAEKAIRLPGVPNTVVAFGQPVTVTAPPPDMIRKKSLEAHSIHVMVDQLKNSLYPSQREWAAEGLASANWKSHPEVVDSLCAGALEDPVPGVRARCVHTLAAMAVRSDKVLNAFRKLQADKEDTVRTEAEEALKAMLTTDLPK